MTIITLANLKGGSGKSTILATLALYMAHEHSWRVAVKDLDHQQHAAAVVDRLAEPLITPYDGQDCDLLLVDTPAGITAEELRELEKDSDGVLIPMALSPVDLDSTRRAMATLKAPEKARVVLNQVNRRTASWQDREEFLEGLSVLRSALGHRVAYVYAMVSGWAALNHAARRELYDLTLEVTGEWLNIT